MPRWLNASPFRRRRGANSRGTTPAEPGTTAREGPPRPTRHRPACSGPAGPRCVLARPAGLACADRSNGDTILALTIWTAPRAVAESTAGGVRSIATPGRPWASNEVHFLQIQGATLAAFRRFFRGQLFAIASAGPLNCATPVAPQRPHSKPSATAPSPAANAANPPGVGQITARIARSEPALHDGIAPRHDASHHLTGAPEWGRRNRSGCGIATPVLGGGCLK